jgi:hypothetical protein
MAPGRSGQGPSGCPTVVVPQHSTEPLATFDWIGGFAYVRLRFDEPIVEALVVSLVVIVGEVRRAAMCHDILHFSTRVLATAPPYAWPHGIPLPVIRDVAHPG